MCPRFDIMIRLDSLKCMECAPKLHLYVLVRYAIIWSLRFTVIEGMVRLDATIRISFISLIISRNWKFLLCIKIFLSLVLVQFVLKPADSWMDAGRVGEDFLVCPIFFSLRWQGIIGVNFCSSSQEICRAGKIMQGKVEGRRRLGRKNLFWLRNIRRWTGLTVEELFRIATDRERFMELVGLIA